MSEFNIEVEGGKAVRLPTAGKYCDRDIVVTATGGGSTMDDFWDAFFETLAYNGAGGARNFQLAFAGAGWNDETFKPNRVIKPLSAYRMFTWALVTDISTANIDFSECTNFLQMLEYARTTNAGVIDTRSATSLAYMFSQASRLVSVEKIILKDDGSQQLDAMFSGCGNLKEVRFEGVIGKSIATSHSPSLSSESVQSIIDHLKDLTGATAQTLTLHATVGAKLTQAQKDAVSAKNWTLVY